MFPRVGDLRLGRAATGRIYRCSLPRLPGGAALIEYAILKGPRNEAARRRALTLVSAMAESVAITHAPLAGTVSGILLDVNGSAI
jgi:hypothetical protein